MAIVTKVNGNMGVVADAQFFGGSKLAFFGIVVKNGSGTAIDLRTELDAGETVEAVYQAIAAKATPVLIQVENASSGMISVGIEQNGAGWTASDLQAAIVALGASVGANTKDVTGTTVTDVGFKLAVA